MQTDIRQNFEPALVALCITPEVWHAVGAYSLIGFPVVLFFLPSSSLWVT